jgi:hypothetical protein
MGPATCGHLPEGGMDFNLLVFEIRAAQRSHTTHVVGPRRAAATVLLRRRVDRVGRELGGAVGGEVAAD